MKEFEIRMFFYFCLSFIFFILISVNMTFFVNFCNKFYPQKNKCQFLFFHFVRFCAVALFFLRKCFNSGITTDCSFLSIKLIWLNPKSDLNLIISGFDNLVCIIIEIAITYYCTNLHRLFTAPDQSCCLYFVLSYLLFCKFIHFFNFVFSLNFFID